MLRTLIWVFFTIAPGLAMANTPNLAPVMEAVRAQDWARAHHLAGPAEGIADDIVLWHRLRAGAGTADETRDFLARRGDWPGLPYLKKRSEGAFVNVDDRRILAFFDPIIPQTAEGAFVYAQALARDGREHIAKKVILRAWGRDDMSAAIQKQYLATYGDWVRPKIDARLDLALWNGWRKEAERLMPMASPGARAVADARLKMQRNSNGIADAIKAIPASHAADPGVAYDRFNWRIKYDSRARAIALIRAQSRVSALGQPEKWAGWRRSLARSEMRAKRYDVAYDLARNHGLSEGSNYADLEWLAGYLSLRFMNNPARALEHFERFEKAVFTPISLGRAGYWRGRAHEKLGHIDAAAEAYDMAARHQTSFYGLLAAERLGRGLDPALAGAPALEWRGADFTKSSVHKAAMAFFAAGELDLAERFWVHLAESQARAGLRAMGDMALDLGAPHVAVMLGKRAVKQGVTLPGPYYALHPLAEANLPVSKELALAIARRESEFDPKVTSHAGARGLMQLMPPTAKQMAGELGLAHHSAKLDDPVYNGRLGAAYLAKLVHRFDGNVVLVSAAYNAGPNRVDQWVASAGDPRRRGVDIVDWIEHIPYRETRNYVMRVSESLPVYRARLRQDPELDFRAELQGRTLRAR